MILASILIAAIIALFVIAFLVLRNNLSKIEMINKVRAYRKLYNALTEQERNSANGQRIARSIQYLNGKIDAK